VKAYLVAMATEDQINEIWAYMKNMEAHQGQELAKLQEEIKKIRNHGGDSTKLIKAKEMMPEKFGGGELEWRRWKSDMEQYIEIVDTEIKKVMDQIVSQDEEVNRNNWTILEIDF
jgi:Mg2+ and Co2+ transporter CorA